MNDLLQSLIGIAVLIGGIGYAYGQWKDRRNSSKLDTVSLFKDQISALEGKVDLQDVEIKKLTAEVHDLKQTIEIKDKKLAAALEILQGRDPQMSAFIKEGLDFMKVTLPIVERMEKYLDKQSF